MVSDVQFPNGDGLLVEEHRAAGAAVSSTKDVHAQLPALVDAIVVHSVTTTSYKCGDQWSAVAAVVGLFVSKRVVGRARFSLVN